jgi:hypothetical protein
MRHQTVLPLCTAPIAVASSAKVTDRFTAASERAHPAAVGSHIGACTLCRLLSHARNSHGTAFHNACCRFKAFEFADAEGDGCSNLQEFTASTLPGDATGSPNLVSNRQPGCDGLICPKRRFPHIGIMKVPGDPFVVGLSRMTVTMNGPTLITESPRSTRAETELFGTDQAKGTLKSISLFSSRFAVPPMRALRRACVLFPEKSITQSGGNP